MSKNRKRRATNYPRLRELLTRPLNTQPPADAPRENPYLKMSEAVMSTPTLQQVIQQCDGETAVAELRDCIIVANTVAQVLAEMFPGCTAMLGIADGAPCATLAFARSRHGNHFNHTAMVAAQDLAKVVAALPDEPLAAFESVVRCARETRRLTAEMEAARAALKAAGDEAHSG